MTSRSRADRGSATAEFAVALPALILLLLFAIGTVNAVLARMRCVDAARDAALAQSRGGDGTAAADRRAPDGAGVSVWIDGDLVHAKVSVTVRILGGHLPGVTVSGDAVAEAEP